MMRIKVLIFPLLLLLFSCNSEQKKIEVELTDFIQVFDSNRNTFYEITDKMKEEGLLLGSETLNQIEKDRFSSELYSKIESIGIKRIKQGRYMPCEAMTEDLREIIFYADENIAYWYCPCMNLTEKNHYHENSELRGYENLIDFNSVGLGGSWAIIKIKN